MKVSVDAEALRQVLQALNGPGHHILELQATRSLDDMLPIEQRNPINVLTKEYNDFVIEHNKEHKRG